MEIPLLKRQLTIKILLGIGILLIPLIIYFQLLQYTHKIRTINKSIFHRVKLSNLKVFNTNKREMILSNNIELWKNISSSQIYSHSYYINNLRLLLNKLCKQNQVTCQDVNISSPVVMDNNYYLSERVGVIKNLIDINFSTASDEYVFLLIEEIKREIPGYIVVRLLDLTRSNINLLYNRNKDLDLIKGKMSFDLYSILTKAYTEKKMQ